MHPAYSVIFFTTASGAGYGLLAWLGIVVAVGDVPPNPLLGAMGLGLAYALITAGLLASTGHLGRPERAWRALSQWRSSWLAREGVAAILSFVPGGLLALGWVLFGRIDGVFALAALAATIMAGITVFITSMIYASLKPIPQWHLRLVPAVYLGLGAASGGLLFNGLTRVFNLWHPAYGWVCIGALIVAAAAKILYWRQIDSAPAPVTLASATGLGQYGSVRLLEMPHTEANFIMREMGYQIARAHAAKLRRISAGLLFVVPLLATLASLSAPPAPGLVLAILAVSAAVVGLIVERWLFFAEAKHVSMIYYGQAT